MAISKPYFRPIRSLTCANNLGGDAELFAQVLIPIGNPNDDFQAPDTTRAEALTLDQLCQLINVELNPQV